MFRLYLLPLPLIAAILGIIAAPPSVARAEPIPCCTLPPKHTVREVAVFRFDKSQDKCLTSGTPGIVQRYVHTQNSVVAGFEMKKGAIMRTHSHQDEQITLIVRGKVKVTVGSKDYIVNPGEVIVLPPRTPHRFEALENTTNLCFFSPAEGWDKR